MNKTAYIATPIYYPSGAPHLGSAYTSTAADIYARFMRLDGFDTRFTTGTDEHGQKIQRKAEEKEVSPIDYLDDMVEQFKQVSEIMNLSEDDFIRTTEPRHIKTATIMWQKLVEAGAVYKDYYAGWYSVPDETYYTEDQLVDGKSPDSGHPVEWVEEESYFFKLSAFQDRLLAYYEQHPDFIRPASRRNEVISFVRSGLEDLSISRSSFNHGIPVPGDEKHVMYVWVDALTNYLSSIGWPDSDKMRYWPIIHVLGKDILRFHAVIWPAMLMAAEVPLPKMVYAHGWWTSGGKKMSKSFGNVVLPAEVTSKYGTDAIRYFLFREITFGADGDFSTARLEERINSDLANSLGNLFQRVLSMIYKNCDAQVPHFKELSEIDKRYTTPFDTLVSEVRAEITNLQFHKALECIWQAISEANKYMDAQQPWVLKKQDPEQMAHVLRVLMESFRYITACLKPFIPEAAAEFERQLGWQVTSYQQVAQGGFFALETGAAIPRPQGVFMRINPEDKG